MCEDVRGIGVKIMKVRTLLPNRAEGGGGGGWRGWRKGGGGGGMSTQTIIYNLATVHLKGSARGVE